MSSILLDDFCYLVEPFGIGQGMQETLERKHHLSRIFTALLTHDELVIRIEVLQPIIELLGIVNTKYLLEHRILKVIEDGGISPAFMPVGRDNLLMNLSNGSAHKFDAILGRMRTAHPGVKVREMLEQLIFNADLSKIVMDGPWLAQQISWENISDLKNRRITSYLGFEHEYTNIIVQESDILALARLNEANKGLIYQSELGITTLSTERGVQQVIASKFGPYQAGNMRDPLTLFQEIGTMKQLPDFTDFFMRRIITVKDIVDLRSSVDGRKFRKWFESEDYNREDVVKILMSGPKKNVLKDFVKHLRWSIPTIIGLINTPLGMITSFADSYFFDKKLLDWHPNWFLDDVLTSQLVAHQDRSRKVQLLKSKEALLSRKVGRNERCPCGSGKKYKYCHG